MQDEKFRRIRFIVALCFFLSFLNGQDNNYKMYTMQDGLSQMKITALHLDSRGLLWIATRNGLNKFNGNEFEVYTNQHGLSHNRVHDVNEDAEGEIIIFNYNGVDQFNGFEFKNYPKSFPNVQYDFEVGPDNRIWICDKNVEKSLWLLEEGNYYLIYKFLEPGNEGISLQLEKSTNTVYLFANDSLFKIQDKSRIYVDHNKYGVVPNVDDFNNRPYFIRYLDIGGDFGYFENGIYSPVVKGAGLENFPRLLINLDENNLWYYHRNVLDLAFDGSNRKQFQEFTLVSDVARDKNGQFWVGTENGLAHIYKQSFESFSYDKLPYIWSVLESDDGDIWFASYGHGLFKYNPESFEIKKYNEGYYFAGSAKDKRGNLFFAKEGGLEKWKGDVHHNLWGQTVFSIDYDIARDQILFGTFDGLAMLNSDEEVRYFGPEDGVHENAYIQSVGIDKNGHYWGGSYTGVSRIDPKTMEVWNYSKMEGNLPGEGVFSCFNDVDGNFWLGGDEGLMYYDDKLDSIYLVESKIVKEMVKAITQFDTEKLLIATKDGLFIFDTKKFIEEGIQSFQFINRSTGYNGIDPGFNSFLRDSQGNIWVCSATSVDKIDPKSIQFTDQSLHVRISKFNGQNIPFNHQDQFFQNPFGDANVRIEFEAIGFMRGSTTNYQFRINGDEWSAWQNENWAILNDLASGEYLFELRAGPVDHFDPQKEIDSIKFRVKLAFYQEKWFPFISIILVFSMLGMVLFYFLRQRAERKRYESQLQEAKYLRSQLLLAELNPHFIFNVLSAIQNKVLFEDKELASQYVVRLSRLIRNFLNASYKGNLLASSKPEYEISLNKEIELLQSYVEFEQIKSNQHFEFHLDLPEGFQADNYMLPPMLIQPFVENAIKHGLLLSEEKGNLWLKFLAENGSLKCIIEDDGVGIRQSQIIRKSSFSTHKSLGSKIVQERIELLNSLGYDIQIQTLERRPNGTIVQIQLKDEE